MNAYIFQTYKVNFRFENHFYYNLQKQRIYKFDLKQNIP